MLTWHQVQREDCGKRRSMSLILPTEQSKREGHVQAEHMQQEERLNILDQMTCCCCGNSMQPCQERTTARLYIDSHAR
jgi:hypothetical protein